MTDPEHLEALARGLSEAQRRVLINGYRTGDRYASLMALVDRKLVAQRVCFADGNGFPLTPLGLAVRAHLQGTPHGRQ